MTDLKSFTVEDAKELIVSKMKLLSGMDSHYRELASLYATFVKAEKELGKSIESDWIRDLRDLKELWGATVELSIEFSPDKYTSLFDNSKKKEIFLAA